jgi:putative ABC transport system substrate-binding protein
LTRASHPAYRRPVRADPRKAPSRRLIRWLIVLTVVLVAAPRAAEPQSSGRIPRIGFLFVTSPGVASPFIEAFRVHLRDLGYVDGRTIAFELRSAEGRADRLPALARELVERKVDIIVAGGGNVSALAARNASGTIPIVMTSSVGAVEAGLVKSLARPGGNVTGLTVPRELAMKQLQLLKELVPSLSRVVILNRRTFDTSAQRAQAQTLVREFLGATLEWVEVREPEDLARAFAALKAHRPDAVIVGPDPLFFDHRAELVEFARATRMPVVYPLRYFVEAGGLISYSLSAVEVARITSGYIDKILRGARPADLPVEQPTTFELVVNMKTARALGLTVPPSVLVQAAEVIE